jgi:hypothetical protein
VNNFEREKYLKRCTTCAEQCANHGGGLLFNTGCLCNDGEFIECKKVEDDVHNGKTD